MRLWSDKWGLHRISHASYHLLQNNISTLVSNPLSKLLPTFHFPDLLIKAQNLEFHSKVNMRFDVRQRLLLFKNLCCSQSIAGHHNSR